MINISYILPKDVSFKRIEAFVKKLIAGNIALGLIALPASTSLSQPQGNLIIPESKLETAFNIQVENNIAPIIQVPIQFIYMSQKFTAFHPGVDLATKFGTPIRPVMKGIVEFAGFSPFGYGNEVFIDNGNGIESLYAHLSKIEVKIGESVEIYTEIGKVGTTGHSSGPHLHLEIHKNGTPINPISFLPPIKEAQTLAFDNDSQSKLITSTLP